ncbi:MAG: aldo/keto reductase [Chloroflexaceae bacterium]|jgi:aryl-alcohol dehydrogenase-like predicted oxidoreductase|nr:aldo/keto reductase [Chloroflexaceae bacterium]
MDYRPFGRTGVKVSALALGCMNFGGRASVADSTAIIHAALAAGINVIDTANVYGHDPANFAVGRGRSEEIVGAALRESGQRDRIFLASKVHFPMGDDVNAAGSSRRHIIAQCEASLRRLQTDWIDLYQLHHPTNEVPIDETLRALDDLVRRGLVRYIGSSAFAAWQLVESLWVAKEYGLNRFVSEQPPYHMLDRRPERELLPMAQTYGMAVMPWSPTAGGFLAGAYRRSQPIPVDSRYGGFWKTAAASHFTEPAFAVLEVVERLSQERGCSMVQLALAWCRQQPGITCPIIGPRTLAHLHDALGTLSITLSAEELAQIDRVAPPGRAVVPYYGADGMAWTSWGPHQHRW